MRARVPDLVILDLMLPGIDGLEVCRALRRAPETRALPIIMLTARTEESDRIAGLELGADDYVTKPFSPNELVARVGALLRRAQRWAESGERRCATGRIELDRERHLRHRPPASEVRLTAKEFLLLEYLLQHRGRVLSRDLLLTDVWGYRYTGGTRTVDVHVRRLREKLPVLGEAIETVKQFGYRLADPTGTRHLPADRRMSEPAPATWAACAGARCSRSSACRRWRWCSPPCSSRLPLRAQCSGRSSAISSPRRGWPRRSSASSRTGRLVAALDGEADRIGALTAARVTFIAPDGRVVGDSAEDAGRPGDASTTTRTRPEVVARAAGRHGRRPPVQRHARHRSALRRRRGHAPARGGRPPRACR